MANSGIPWIDTIFDWCVIALNVSARWLGISYEAINVWLFCIAWPVFTIALIAWSVSLWRQNRKLQGRCNGVS